MNKGLFIHILVTMAVIAGYLFIMHGEKSTMFDRCLTSFVILMVNIGLAAEFQENGFYSEKIKL